MSASADRAYKTLVCVIDGNRKHLDVTVQALATYYLVVSFTNSQEGLDWLRTNSPALVVMDEDTVPLSGLSLLEAFFRISFSRLGQTRPPLVCMGSRKGSPFLLRARDLGADFLLLKPFKASQLIHVLSALINRRVEENWERLPEVVSDALLLSADLFDSLSDMVENDIPLPLSGIANCCKAIAAVAEQGRTELLLTALSGHNNLILVHSLRVAIHLAMFGRVSGLSGGSLMSLIMGGLLHDLGKIGIPFQVLNKPGAISFDDRRLMRGHVECTLAMLKKTPGMPKSVMSMVAQHHERLDGTGYPNRLVDEEIPLFSRQLAIADVFCAMTDIRPYREPMSREKALEAIAAMRGAFDSTLLAAFAQLVTQERSLVLPSEPAFQAQEQPAFLPP